MLKERQAAIKAKGFNMVEADDDMTNTNPFEEMDFSKMRVGLRTINDALVNLGSYKKINRSYGDKSFVLNAIYRHDYATMREISKYFYESSGIYYRLCRYLAFLYRYDWYVTPYINDMREDKVLKEVSKVLLYLDKSEVKRICGNIALDIMVEGAYYGTVIDFGDKFAI